MNRQFGCRITETDGTYVIENRYGDRYVYRLAVDGERFLIQNRVDGRWNTRALRYSRADADAWLRYEYSEAEPVVTAADDREHRRWLARNR